MREYDDYDDESIRLYTPVLQRVIILAAVVIGSRHDVDFRPRLHCTTETAGARARRLCQLSHAHPDDRTIATQSGSTACRSIGAAAPRWGLGERCNKTDCRNQERASKSGFAAERERSGRRGERSIQRFSAGDSGVLVCNHGKHNWGHIRDRQRPTRSPGAKTAPSASIE